jgi:hypothetical protein
LKEQESVVRMVVWLAVAEMERHQEGEILVALILEGALYLVGNLLEEGTPLEVV